MFLEDFWNCLTKVHEHEVGEDRDGCYNCRLVGKVAAMSEFEATCLNWYFDTVNDFSMSAGIVAESFRDLGLGIKAKRFFLKAQEFINRSQTKIAGERAKMEQKETSGMDNG